jgi:phosphate:Na+ symporter
MARPILRVESIETTSLHLDVLHDLRRVHSHICSVAYPVLDAAKLLPYRSESAAISVPATQPYSSRQATA